MVGLVLVRRPKDGVDPVEDQRAALAMLVDGVLQGTRFGRKGRRIGTIKGLGPDFFPLAVEVGQRNRGVGLLHALPQCPCQHRKERHHQSHDEIGKLHTLVQARIEQRHTEQEGERQQPASVPAS